MKMNKILYLGIIPVLALTSCGSNMTKISYDAAYNYVKENFNPNALNTISCSTDYNLNELGINLNVLAKGKEGETETTKVAFGINGVTTSIQDVYADVLNTVLLDSIYQYYTTFASLSLKFITNIPVDLNFYKVNDGSFRVDVESNGLQNSIYNLLDATVGLFNIPQIRIAIIEKIFGSIKGAPSEVQMIETFFESNAVGFDPINSGSKNDKFDLYCVTDNNGYIVNKGLVINSDIDVVTTISTYKEPWNPSESKLPPEIISTREYYVSGHIGMDFNVKSNLNK